MPDAERPAPERQDDARDDGRSDIEQAVDARRDALDRGEGGDGDGALAPTGTPDGIGGTAGVVRNQGDDAQ